MFQVSTTPRISGIEALDSKAANIIYKWPGDATTDEDVTSEEEAASEEKKGPKTQNIGGISIRVDTLDTPPNTPEFRRNETITPDTKFLTMDNLLLPAVLQKKLSKISTISWQSK